MVKLMANTKVKQILHECNRCKFRWYPRDIVKLPKQCPRCKSPNWNAKLRRKCRMFKNWEDE